MPFVPHASLSVRVRALSPPALAALYMLFSMAMMSSNADAASMEAQEAGFIEIILRTCPPGYDVTASGAEPIDDCPLAGDGIRFTLRDDDPATDDRHAETGERERGVVHFQKVDTGQYVLTEEVPDGVAEVVVVSCRGFNTGPFYRMPLHEGSKLNIPVPNNSPITCDWINILAPGASPQASPVATPAATPGGSG